VVVKTELGNIEKSQMPCAEPISNNSQPQLDEPARFAHLDGIRGVAALYVAAFHCYQMQLFVSPNMDPSRALLFKVFKPLCMGHYAVTVFIVLSGFCLMLPVARAGGSYVLKDGWYGYMRRRARRILPPFYVAVVLTLALFPISKYLWERLAVERGAEVQSALGGAESAVLWPKALFHLLLCNNGVPISNETLVKFSNNTPLWSVATEWQIYFLFPAILLPILARFGAWASVSACVGIGMLFSVAFDGRYRIACPWMFGVFAIGALGALISCGADPIFRSLRARVSWGLVGSISCLTFVAIGVAKLGMYRENPVITDTLLGLAIMSCLIGMSCVSADEGSRVGKWCVNVLSSRSLAIFGGLSYSLYLIHYPLIVLFQAWFLRICSSLIAVDILMLFPAMVVIVGIAYVFSIAFERPLLRKTAEKT